MGFKTSLEVAKTGWAEQGKEAEYDILWESEQGSGWQWREVTRISSSWLGAWVDRGAIHLRTKREANQGLGKGRVHTFPHPKPQGI